MKYYVVEIASGDANISGKAIYEYDSETAAVAAYHGKLSTAMKSDMYASDLVIVIDEAGRVIKREYYLAEE